MPTYEYLCKNCGERLEVFQKFSAKPLRVHDECGGDLQKVFHASGVVFKGSGYYVTDSRSSSSAPAAKTETPGAKDGSKKASKEKSSGDSTNSESKSDSKSDSKSESKSSKSDSKSDAVAAS